MRTTLVLVLLLACVSCQPELHAPIVSLTAPEDGAVSLFTTTVSFLQTDDHDPYTNYSIMANGDVLKSGYARNRTVVTETITLAPGTYDIWVEARDRDGMVGRSQRVTITILPEWDDCLGTVVPNTLIIHQPPDSALYTKTWLDGFSGMEADGGMRCEWGAREGQNVHYLYCTALEARRLGVTDTGVITERTYYDVRLAGHYAIRQGAGEPFVEANTVLRVVEAECKVLEAPVLERCTDSDDGIAYYTRGTLSSGATDVCGDFPVRGAVRQGVVREYYCDRSGSPRFILYVCPNGCQDGACIP